MKKADFCIASSSRTPSYVTDLPRMREEKERKKERKKENECVCVCYVCVCRREGGGVGKSCLQKTASRLALLAAGSGLHLQSHPTNSKAMR